MTRTVVSSPDAPAAIGPYSQAVSVSLGPGGGLVFCSGQVALGRDGLMVGAGDVTLETEQVMRNLEAVLRAADCDFSHVVKATIYCTSLGDYGAINDVYARYFADAAPARVAVEVSGLPKGAKVEIELIAARG